MTNFVDKVEALKMRYLLLFVMATLTAVGQSTKPDLNIVWFPDGGYACGRPDQPSTTPCRMPTDAEIAAHMPKPKKHKAHPGFKQTPCAKLAASDVQIQDSGKCYVPIKKLDFIYICSPCTSQLLQFNNPVNDGVAAWDAPKPPVPEDIKDGTICDNLPETQKITCLMNLVAPEKAIVPEPDPIKTAQDGYDCQITEKIVAFAQKDYPPNYEGDVLTKKVIAAISCTLKEPK